MDDVKKELNWLEFVLLVLFLGCGIYGVYNIQYSVFETIKWLLISSVSFVLYMACDEEVLFYFSKWELIKFALFKNFVLCIILFFGAIYDIGDNAKLAAEFFFAGMVYFIVIILTNTWENDGFFVVFLALIYIFVLLLYIIA